MLKLKYKTELSRQDKINPKVLTTSVEDAVRAKGDYSVIDVKCITL